VSSYREAHPTLASAMAGEIEYANKSTHCTACDVDLRGPVASEVILVFEGRGLCKVFPVKVCRKCAMRLTSYPVNTKVREAVNREIRRSEARMDRGGVQCS